MLAPYQNLLVRALSTVKGVAMNKSHLSNCILMLALVFAIFAPTGKSKAAEGGAGFYLLGTKGSFAGILPPPGLYFTSDNYFYSGKASVSRPLPTLGGEFALGLNADVFASVNSLLLSTPTQFLGARTAFGVVVPVIDKTVRAGATLDLNGLALGASDKDKIGALGDPLLTAIMGWDSGNWHATLNFLLNIPIGVYELGALANAGFNRWGLDVTSAFTYFDPTTGFEVTAVPGLTFNGENRDSGYKTGTEFHLEFAALKHFSQQFALGVAGFHYQQITGDKGSALGDFKGRVTAVGPTLNFGFQLGSIPVAGKAKYFREFNEKNRLKGDVALLQFAIPLAGATAAPPPN